MTGNAGEVFFQFTARKRTCAGRRHSKSTKGHVLCLLNLRNTAHQRPPPFNEHNKPLLGSYSICVYQVPLTASVYPLFNEESTWAGSVTTIRLFTRHICAMPRENGVSRLSHCTPEIRKLNSCRNVVVPPSIIHKRLRQRVNKVIAYWKIFVLTLFAAANHPVWEIFLECEPRFSKEYIGRVAFEGISVSLP